LKSDFAGALSFCKNFGMNLAAFSTLDEYDHFKKTIVQANKGSIQMELFFVGGMKIGSKNWYWLPNGMDLNYSLNWGPGEPDNPVREQCLTFYVNKDFMNFNDMLCSTLPIRFLCEKSTKIENRILSENETNTL
jgi:hypothetical protein